MHISIGVPLVKKLMVNFKVACPENPKRVRQPLSKIDKIIHSNRNREMDNIHAPFSTAFSTTRGNVDSYSSLRHFNI